MQTTFLLAGNFGVTPFEIMAQDVDEVIMIINYLCASGKARNGAEIRNNTLTEKEQDASFWAAL